jgi:hypothetical protein
MIYDGALVLISGGSAVFRNRLRPYLKQNAFNINPYRSIIYGTNGHVIYLVLDFYFHNHLRRPCRFNISDRITACHALTIAVGGGVNTLLAVSLLAVMAATAAAIAIFSRSW